MSSLLKKAYDEFLHTKDEAKLLEVIKNNTSIPPESLDSPYYHRVCDLNLMGVNFRLTRLANKEEDIFITPCSTPALDQPGVPYWLTGEKLQEWVKLEEGSLRDEDYEVESPVDWNRFK